MNDQAISRLLELWAKSKGLRVSDVYRDQFYYVDVVDDVGGNYEISISLDVKTGLIKVAVRSSRKGSCGYKEVGLSDLESVLELAYARIENWTRQQGGTRVLAA